MRSHIPGTSWAESCRGTNRRGGAALRASLRGRLERALGADLSTVRVHVGAWPRRIGALAFACGEDLFFAPGWYRPDLPERQRLLVHELAHVLQQRAGRVPPPAVDLRAVVVDPGLEAEAEDIAERALRPGARDLMPTSAADPDRPRLVQPVLVIAYTKAQLTVHGVTATVVTSAETTLTSVNTTGGSGPSGTILPPGFVTGLCPNHHQRGHLIGNQVGGPGTVADNLVTMTEGTNHPVMFEFEDMVFKHVKANPGVTFNYKAIARYDSSRYLTAPAAIGGATHGAANNPYCPFPCPESFEIHFTRNVKGQIVYPISVNTMVTEPYVDNFGQPQVQSYYVQVQAPVVFTNGVYKFHEGSPKHVANQCWAS